MPLAAFEKDPWYALRNFIAHAVFFLGVDAALLIATGFWRDPRAWAWFAVPVLLILPFYAVILLGGLVGLGLLCLDPAFHPSWAYVGVLPAAYFFSGQMNVFMHNAAHGNFRPRWLNRVLGETIGVFQVYGFTMWQVSHQLHHRHPDDPERDPHPPLHEPFWRYTNLMKQTIGVQLGRHHARCFQNVPGARAVWVLGGLVSLAASYLRVVFFLLILGPVFFGIFYVPAILMHSLFYCHFNYFTHRPRADGGYEILNLDSGLYYKVSNALFWGTYFHKNHHLLPHLFNPRDLPPASPSGSLLK